MNGLGKGRVYLHNGNEWEHWDLSSYLFIFFYFSIFSIFFLIDSIHLFSLPNGHWACYSIRTTGALL